MLRGSRFRAGEHTSRRVGEVMTSGPLSQQIGRSPRPSGPLLRRITHTLGLNFVLAAVLLRLALEFVYREVISVVFGYEGFPEGFALVPYLESWAAFLALLFVVPKRLSRPSDFFVAYLVFVTALPFIVLYPAMQAPSWKFWLLVSTVFAIVVFRRPSSFNFVEINYGRELFIAVALLIISFVTLWLLFFGGLRNFNLDLKLVYEVREGNDTLGAGALIYLLSVWTTKVFGPILLAVSLLNRRYALAMIMVLLHILWFGISQHKSVLFYPALVFLSFRYVKQGGGLLFLPLSLLAVTAASYLFYFFSEDILMLSMLVRRALFTPALLTFEYYDFFSRNDFVYWTNSMLNPFMSDIYKESISTLISWERGGSGGANNHFLATGYMQAGAFGLLIYAVIVIMILKIFDSFQDRGLPLGFLAAVGIVPIHALFHSADLPVAVLTHGLGICVVSLILVSSQHGRYETDC